MVVSFPTSTRASSTRAPRRRAPSKWWKLRGYRGEYRTQRATGCTRSDGRGRVGGGRLVHRQVHCRAVWGGWLTCCQTDVRHASSFKLQACWLRPAGRQSLHMHIHSRQRRAHCLCRVHMRANVCNSVVISCSNIITACGSAGIHAAAVLTPIPPALRCAALPRGFALVTRTHLHARCDVTLFYSNTYIYVQFL